MIIVGSILASLWALQIGSVDALEIRDTTSSAFEVSVPQSTMQQGENDTPIAYNNDEGWDYIEGDNENEHDVLRRAKRIKKRQRSNGGSKGGGKGGGKGNKEVTTEDRAISDLRLEECIQSVLDESSTTAFAPDTRAPGIGTESSETSAPRSDIPESEEEEEMLFIRRLLEGPDGFLNSRETSTCDIEITDQMQEMVSK